MNLKIENIPTYGDFKLPIFYQCTKTPLNHILSNDLELTKINEKNFEEDNECNPESVYDIIFKPKLPEDKELCYKWSEFTSSNIRFLGDSQKLIQSVDKSVKFEEEDEFLNNIDDTLNLQEEDFLNRYMYLDYNWLKSFNSVHVILLILSLNTLLGPLQSLLSPLSLFFLALIPIPNLKETKYLERVKLFAVKHPLWGLFFGSFKDFKYKEKLNSLISIIIFGFRSYFNVKSFKNFIKIIRVQYDYVKSCNEYLVNSLEKTELLMEKTSKLKSYSDFHSRLENHKSNLKLIINRLSPIACVNYSLKNIGFMGKCRAAFYDLYTNEGYKETVKYSRYLNSFIHQLNILQSYLKNKIISKAKFGGKKFYIKGLIHPIFKERKGIKNDCTLMKNYLITGPNASGKTTFIKSIMINTIITQQFGMGFYEKARIRPYIHFHCYLNIPDTSGRDSLFQAESRRCKEVIDALEEDDQGYSLCLFDELFSGTNPEEAAASAFAFIEYLSKKSNCRFLLTTHFYDVCLKIDSNKSILNLHMDAHKENEKIKYFYKIKKGISNLKGGLSILKDLNYPKHLIDNAKSFSESV